MQVRLSTPDVPPLAEVGGKVASLIRLGQAGFNVPGGVVLTTAFFAPWIQQIEISEAWQLVISTVNNSPTHLPNLDERERLAQACDEVKQFAADTSYFYG